MNQIIPKGVWNNFCFGVNIIFWPQKGSFSKNMDFGVILGDIHIIKMLKLQTNFPPGRNFSNVKISFPLHSRTPKTNKSLWASHFVENSKFQYTLLTTFLRGPSNICGVHRSASRYVGSLTFSSIARTNSRTSSQMNCWVRSTLTSGEVWQWRRSCRSTSVRSGRSLYGWSGW